MPSEPVLEIRSLSTVFDTPDGPAQVVRDVSFQLHPGEMVGLVGESGCGKTVTALSILRLVRPPGHIVAGEVYFEGRDILALPERQMRALRGDRISMVFQEPMTALNPVFTIADQLTEVLLFHRRMPWAEAWERSVDALRDVGLPDPGRIMDTYPHQLSGGMRQRVLIAMGLLCSPAVLIADEPTTAIDVTVQVQVVELLSRFQEQSNLAVLLITHDLGIVAQSCRRVLIMYASRIVESGSVRDIFHSPRHPYTIALLQSMPSVHRPGERLAIIPGQVPQASRMPAGCGFHTRCPHAQETCLTHSPPLDSCGDGHTVACWRWQEIATR
jgi:peptide/nickel transport system ATP-binding protein